MIPIWGSPWRGKIQGGLIELPNATTKASPQPQGLLARHYDELGYTYLQRGPLASAARTPEELAADGAVGRTWRTDAILSGARMYLYGAALNGWVYCATDGTRWLVPADALRVSLQTDQPLSVDLTLKAFGDPGAPAAEQVVNAAVADLGQAEPDSAYPAGTTAYSVVCDITPTGDRALLMLYQPVIPFSSTSGFHPLHKRPLGWLELELTGGAAGITATLTVVRTRAQAFGSGVKTLIDYTTVTKFEQPDTLSRVDMGTYYEDTYTPTPLGATGATGWSWDEGAGNFEFSFANRILALWYLPDLTLEECTLDVSVTATENNPAPTETISGSHVQHVPKNGDPTIVISDDREHKISRSSSATEACSIKLKRGGVLIEEVSGSATSALSQTRWFIRQSGDPWTSDRTDSVTIAGVTDDSSGSFSGSPPPQGLGVLHASWLTAALPGNSPAQAAYRSSDMLLLTPARSVTLDPLRYSNNLLSLRRYTFLNADSSETYQAGVAARPGGTDGALVTTSFGALFGAYNPATTEVVRDQTTAVCWI